MATFSAAQRIDRHGFVVEIDTDNSPNWFTGAGYSAYLSSARVFRTVAGAMAASRIWQTADYGRPLPASWYDARRVRPVALSLQLP